MLSGCGHTFSFRYRLTLEVETPEGIKTGTGVLECNASSSEDTSFKGFGGAGGYIRGEAITVDLGKRGVMFALLIKIEKIGEYTNYEYAFNLPIYVTKRAGRAIDGRRARPPRYNLFTDYVREVAGVQGKLRVEVSDLPTLVRFRDVNDSTSVEQVDPFDLAVAFGPGVRWRSITLEMTDGPVTTGIEKKLTWLPSLPTVLGGQPGKEYGPSATLANSLNSRSFVRKDN